MRVSLVPRERRFYELFDQQAATIVEAGELLAGLRERTDIERLQSDIRDLEHRGDDLTHEVQRTLNRTFVTPFDREDIYALSSGLDDILDLIDDAVDTVMLYHIKTLPPAVGTLAGLVRDATVHLCRAVAKLEPQRGIEEHWIEVHRIENEGDTVSRNAIAELFSGSVEPLEVIKLKDVYALLEDALDRCEDVCNIIESIIIKNA